MTYYQSPSTEPMPNSVGIITINLNQKKLVEDFIQEIKDQTYQNYHLYIIDNGSGQKQKIDGTLLHYNWLSHIETGKNLGFTGGNNAGIQQALKDKHEFVWIVNNDTRLDPDCLKRLVGYLTEHPDVAIVGPKIYYEAEPNTIWFAGGQINWQKPFPYSMNTHLGERMKDEGQFGEIKEVDFITGCSMLIKREVLEKIGGFDDQYFLYFEDADFSLKTKNLGYKTVYYPKAKMWHIVGAFSGVTSPRSSYYQIRNSLLFVSRWAPWWSKILAYINVIIILIKNLIKLLIPRKKKFATAQLRAVKDFLRGKFGGPSNITT